MAERGKRGRAKRKSYKSHVSEISFDDDVSNYARVSFGAKDPSLVAA